jgi:hypothetical protein
MGLFKEKVLFTKDECDSIINQYLPSTSEFVNKGCSYASIPIDKTDNRWILDRIIKWIEEEVNCDIDWDNNTSFDEVYFQSYKIGDKFGKHDDNVYNRVYTAGLLLNDGFDGGNFLVDTTFDNSVSFKNVIGNCYVIESMLKHEVTEITKGCRSVIIVFIKHSQINSAEAMNELPKII